MLWLEVGASQFFIMCPLHSTFDGLTPIIIAMVNWVTVCGGWKNVIRGRFNEVALHIDIVWFLCLNGISTLFRLFNAKAILLEEQYWYYLTHSWEDKGAHTFPKGICPKVNVIARLEYELASYDSAVHRFNHYTTRTPPAYRYRYSIYTYKYAYLHTHTHTHTCYANMTIQHTYRGNKTGGQQ